MRSRMVWLIVVSALIIIQGLVYQQFLVLTETGLRVIFESGSYRDLIWVCLAVFIIFSVRAVMSFLIPTISAKLSTAALFELRRDLAKHVLHLPQSYFDAKSTGDLILRMVNQVQQLSTFVGQASVKALRDLATVIIVSSYLIYKNIYLFSIAVIIIPLIALLMLQVFKIVKKIQKQTEKAVGSFITNIDEMKSGMRTIKMSGQEETEANRIQSSALEIKRQTFRLMRTHAFTPPVIDLSSAFVYMLVIGGGGYMALSDHYAMDGASIITFLIGLVLVFDPARNVAQFLTQLQSSLVLLESVRSIFDVAGEDLQSGKPIQNSSDPFSIKFEDVSFSYKKNHKTLNSISLEFKAGTKNAIVGSTGSGKTTILSLIGKLYAIDEGKITLNGQNISELSLTSLRDQISIVSQDIVIFDHSLEDNIRYAKPEATDAEVFKAAQEAKIESLIEERNGAPVGPKGSQLSGGQKQRVALARTFLKPAPILLLDEATSALDSITEASIAKALMKLSNNRTTIVVAHKLDLIKDADMIFVLEDGRIVESGNHEKLSKSGKFYTSLLEAQKVNYK
ncbi:ABC transporter ATP-binding protein/permease [Rhodobacteraceae bacterium]|nr:ABC transporter ATP-binding protein/permease [Paracoccaceae bacterium]